jgi:hypothetical protein
MTAEIVPARIVLESARPALAYELAAELEQRGLGPVEVRHAEDGPPSLRHGPATPLQLVTRLLDVLRPLAPDTVGPDDALAAGELIVRLPEPGDVLVEVRADSPELLGRVAGLVEKVGLRLGQQHLEVQDHCRLHHASAPIAARQALRWALGRAGLRVEEQDHTVNGGDGGVRIELRLRDPEQAARPLPERFGVEIATDDLDAADALRNRLLAEGFAFCRVSLIDEDGEEEPRFRLHPGPFSNTRAPADLARLRQCAEGLMTSAGLDGTHFPLAVTRVEQGAAARIELPLRRFRRPDARPYAGPFPERFDVVVHSDDPSGLAGLRKALAGAGYRHVEFRKVASLLDSPHADVPAGLVLRWSAAGREKSLAADFRALVEKAMQAMGGTLPLEVADQAGNGVIINLFFPVKGVADGRLAAWLADPRRYRVKLIGGERDEWNDLKAQLEGMGFEVQETTEGSSRPRGRLEFGAAPAPLVERVVEHVRVLAGTAFPARRVQGGDDLVISITLPKRQRKQAAAPEPAFDLAAWLGEMDLPARSFIEVSPGEVRVGNVRLPRRGASAGPLVPSLAGFEHFCLDEITAATLEHLAAGVLLFEPCLLEGETSTSKTSGILYLAALLRQPVARINLNGQTDTGELIGRFVPRDSDGGGDNLDYDRCEGGTALAVRERASIAGSLWRWQDGLIVQAMKQGWWVLLDEVNLAEPQILERLNSVLEADPTLVLTEYDNSPVTPVHPWFRLFATMNPAEYAGRSVLSPAYRDRWRGYRYVPRPTEREYLAMLRQLVHGEQPGVMVQGQHYAGGKLPARYAALSKLLSDEVLIGLARFQASLEHAAGRSGEAARLGGRRKERHVFTRRGLLSVLDFLVSPLGVAGNPGPRAVRAALLRYYLARVATAEDQALVVQLLDASGLGPRSGGKKT